jgi:uncharacterized sulfatase
MKQHPNILFITTDQQRRDTLGCYGNDLIQTPNIDKLADQGVIFDRAYCESPICLPSRVTMITGKKASHHGVTLHNHSMRNDEKTIGELLQTNGYRTHFIGKPHFKSQQHRGTEESIADWKDGKFEGWNGPYAGFETIEMILGHSNSLVGHYGQWLRKEHPEKYQLFRSDNLEPLNINDQTEQGTFHNRIPEEIFSSTYVGDRTCAFIDSMKDTEQPFYCFASFPDPHWPIMPPEPYFSMYDNTEMPQNTPYNDEVEKSNYPPQFKKAKNGKRTHYDGGGSYMTNPEDTDKIMRPYWGAVSLIDKNVGRILAALEACGMNENTIVVFTTDHGEYMGAHGMMAKGGFLWQEFINVPFIIRYPKGIKQGMRSEALLSFTDIVPTLLDLANIKNDYLAVDGISQKEVLTGKHSKQRDCVTVIHPSHIMDRNVPDQHCLVTDDHWKLVYYAGHPTGELYNLQDDPHELNNLYNKPEFSEIQLELTLKLLDQIILDKDKEAIMSTLTADHFGRHIMTDEHWHDEFEQMAKQTGIK